MADKTCMQADSASPHTVAFWRPGDWGFLAALALALLTVVWCGRFSFKEGMLLEVTKANGEAVAAWATELADRKSQPLTLASCASLGAESPTLQGEADWGPSRQALLAEGGPLAQLSNPFGRQNPVLGQRCDKKNPSARGVVTLEKGTPSLPGMPASVSWEPFADDESLVRGMLLRVQACDAGGYVLKIAEIKL
jgi:hypothetical protein